jgi:hypothetical protein
MALSWPNLLCALKPALGNGKRTLRNPPVWREPRGPRQGPWALSGVRAPTPDPRAAIASTRLRLMLDGKITTEDVRAAAR